jgi:serine protease Do
LRAILATHAPGDRIELTVQRGESTFTVNIELANMENIDPDFERSNQQNRMGSTLSKRRQDFPLAFQHDAGVQANQCGSPLVDSNGQIVGINISRSGRVSTLALPMEVVLPAIERLRSGELAPAVIYKSRLEQIEKELAGLTTRLAELPQQLAAAESKASGDEVRKAEVQRMADELKTRLEELERTAIENSAEVKRYREELKTLERKQKKLREEQQDLTLEADRK